MKRSEMVGIIEKEIRTQNGGTCILNGSMILSIIESAGMLPPEREHKSEGGWVQEWEPED